MRLFVSMKNLSHFYFVLILQTFFPREFTVKPSLGGGDADGKMRDLILAFEVFGGPRDSWYFSVDVNTPSIDESIYIE